MAPAAHDVVQEESSADGEARRGAEAGGAESLVASHVHRLQRTAGNRATIAWLARAQLSAPVRGGAPGGRRLQRKPAATPELQSEEQAKQYAKTFAAASGKRSLTDETRTLFRFLLKTHAPAEWARLGKDWTFDDYPFQDFTFAVMPDRAGTGFLLGIGPAFVKRMATGDVMPVVRDFKATFKQLDQRLRSPEMSGAQPAVPKLGPDKTAEVVAKITARDPQGALDVLVRAKIQDGTIDPRLLENGAMSYDPDLSEDGICSMQRWDYITNKAEPTAVRIGKGAFSSVAYLSSVVMHEYQHVLQRQSLTNQQNEAALRAQGTQSGNEVDAYAWELIRAADSGLQGLPNKVADVWSSLNEEYWKLNAAERAKVLPLAKRAQARAQAMVKGTGFTLDPFQAP